MMTRERLHALLLLALRAVARAAPEILEVYGGAFSVEPKADRSPITEADRRSHRVILQVLAQPAGPAGGGRPLPILSEEGREIPYAERRRWRSFWLVDPLDGTEEFVNRNDEFTINIAVIRRRRPILGVVYAPVYDLLYFAHRRLGAFKMEGFLRGAAAQAEGLGELLRGQAAPVGEGAAETPQPPSPSPPELLLRRILPRAQRLPRRPSLRLREGRRLPRLVVAGSRSHRDAEFEGYLETLRARFAEQVELIIMGSSLKPCLVAEGKADLYPRFGRTFEWDMAAAHAVVTAVGKHMVAFEGRRELRYNKRDLANPSLLVL
jgi:3'(2'), 5'-bisphosphate nucleotidase